MATLRNYPNDPSSSIYQHYYNKNTKQTLEFVRQKLSDYHARPKISMTMSEAFASMNDYIDPSDPDTSGDNLIHAYQTAERIRKDYPENKLFQVVGLIHDVGKILYKFGKLDSGKLNTGAIFTGDLKALGKLDTNSKLIGEENFAVVGDTFPVGCEHSEKCVYSEFFAENPDKYDKIGIYSRECGLDSLLMTWGHDEYLYRVLKDNKHKISELALSNPIWEDLGMRVIRYHSFYPLHEFGAYTYFLSDDDWEFIHWLKKFNQYDLYSKNDTFVLTDETRQYYDKLLGEYFPTPLYW